MEEPHTHAFWQRFVKMAFSLLAAGAISALLAILLWAAKSLQHG